MVRSLDLRQDNLLHRYALVSKTSDGWAIDPNFVVTTSTTYDPWATEDGESYYLPVERDFQTYDEELWQRYLNGYHVEGNRVVERFRYEPVPNFNELLLHRAMTWLEREWQPIPHCSIAQVLELQGTLFEAQECLKLLEQGFEPDRGEFMLLEAMLGQPYDEPTVGTLTIETVPEAARVILKDYHRFRRTALSVYKEKRLAIRGAIFNATSPEAAESYVRDLIEGVNASV